MTNFLAIPFSLTFPAVNVQGAIPALVPNPTSTKSFTLYNNSGASVTITNYGFADTTEGDAVTQPAGILPDSDFTVTVSDGFPTTIANGSNKSFTVAYAPLRRGSGFGDIRSAILMFYSGKQALSNGGQTLNSSGEVVNLGLPQLFTIGVGGGVIEEGYDWATAAPIYQGAGNPAQYVAPDGYGNNAPLGLTGIGANFDLADMDTARHSVSAIPLYSGIIATSGSGTTTPSTGIEVHARSVQVLVYGLDTATTFDLEIDAYTTSGLKSVAVFPGLNFSNIGGLFIGNAEGVDLLGLNLYASITNVINPNSVTITIGVVVTG